MRALLFTLAMLLLVPWRSASAACPRPTLPGGVLGVGYEEAEVFTVEGPRVVVHYALEGPHALLDTADEGGVPRGAKVVLDEVERALDVFEAAGFPPPPSDVTAVCDGDGDERYDIYLLDFASADGHAVVESCRGQICTSFARVARDLSRRYGSTRRGAQIVAVHELFHSIQFAAHAGLPTYWSEGSAQWAADFVNPGLGDLEAFLAAFFQVPERPLDSQGAGGLGSWSYSTAIWPVFLHERYGDGAVAAVFDALKSTDLDDAYEVSLGDRGSSLAEAFATFGAFNAATGARAAGDGYAKAVRYPELEIAPLEATEASLVLTGLSTNYLEITQNSPFALEVELDPERAIVSVLSFDAEGRLPLSSRRVIDGRAELPAGRFAVVVSSVSSSKRDNRVTVRLAELPAPTEPPSPEPSTPPEQSEPSADDSSGCSIVTPKADMNQTSFAPLLFLALALVACARKSSDTEAPSPAPEPASSRAGSAGAEPKAAERIVSVGSANTETVYALGLGSQVVAVDTSSLFPAETEALPKVGYQRALSVEGVLSVKPSLVLLPPEGGPPQVLEQLRSSGLRIEVIAPPASEDGTLQRIDAIARLLGADPKPLTMKVRNELEEAKAEAQKLSGEPKVLVIYARGPGTVQAFGQQTPADRLLTLAHAKNAAQGFEGSRPITAEAVVAWAPDWILVPARGLDSLGGVDGVLQQPGLKETPAGKAKQVVGVDDLLLLGFGPRTGEAVRTVARAVHPTP